MYFVKGDRPPVLSLNELAPVLGLNKPNSYMLIVFAKYVMFYAIWCRLDHLKNVKNAHGGVLFF